MPQIKTDIIPHFKDCTLQERQQYYYNGSNCYYCRVPTDYVDSIEVYQKSYGFIFLCRKCGSYVNTHNGQDQAFGFTANKVLRDARHNAHLMFDPLVQSKVDAGMKRKLAQTKAREWLSKQLNIDVSECHMGMMELDRCNKVIELCKPFHLTREQIEARKKELEQKLQLVRDYSKEFLFELKEFQIMGTVQMELKHSDGKILYIKPKTKEARWAHKKKPFKFEDIEQLIIKHFKP